MDNKNLKVLKSFKDVYLTLLFPLIVAIAGIVFAQSYEKKIKDKLFIEITTSSDREFIRSISGNFFDTLHYPRIKISTNRVEPIENERIFFDFHNSKLIIDTFFFIDKNSYHLHSQNHSVNMLAPDKFNVDLGKLTNSKSLQILMVANLPVSLQDLQTESMMDIPNCKIVLRKQLLTTGWIKAIIIVLFIVFAIIIYFITMKRLMPKQKDNLPDKKSLPSENELYLPDFGNSDNQGFIDKTKDM